MNSNNPYTKRDKYGCFVSDNDSVAISYGFSANGGAIKINVENKSAKTIYVDWQASQIMLDNNPEQSFSYGDYLPYDATAEYIYPHTSKAKQFNVFDDYKFNKLKGKFEKKRVLTAENKNTELLARTFTEADSPLFFTSELSMHLSLDSISTPTIFAQDFYVAEVAKGGSQISPSILGISDSKTSDSFYVKHEVGQNFWYTVGGIVLIGAIGTVYVISGAWERDLEDDDY